MSDGYLPGDAQGGDEPATVRALGELAGSVETGAVPYDRLIAGGRRRLRRRRLLTAGAAAVLVAGIAGGTAVLGERGRQAVSTVAVASASVTAAAAPGSPGAPATVSAAPSAAGVPATRDPFTPVRVKLAEGAANGHTWQAWAALWPAPSSKEDFAKQARLIQAERHETDPKAKPVTQKDIDINWDPRIDRVNYYYTVDGKRQADDALPAVSAPGGFPAAVGGASLGLHDDAGVPAVVIEGVQAEVAKVVVAWKTGGTTEAVAVTVGDSPFRFYALAAKPGTDAAAVTYYKADGSVERTTELWLRTS
ncbi:hypothetical protein ACGF0D_23135 [Kitasatospora sp. NPDC048298]|uniref:hypothetical protein n=1 Tax=Kitasatospora sp. NPDC048298 TaxID=3364049 RepID=UPI003717D67D